MLFYLFWNYHFATSFFFTPYTDLGQEHRIRLDPLAPYPIAADPERPGAFSPPLHAIASGRQPRLVTLCRGYAFLPFPGLFWCEEPQMLFGYNTTPRSTGGRSMHPWINGSGPWVEYLAIATGVTVDVRRSHLAQSQLH